MVLICNANDLDMFCSLAKVSADFLISVETLLISLLDETLEEIREVLSCSSFVPRNLFFPIFFYNI